AAEGGVGSVEGGNFAVRGGVCEGTDERRAALSGQLQRLVMPIGARTAALAAAQIVSVREIRAVGPDQGCPRRRWPTGQVSRVSAPAVRPPSSSAWPAGMRSSCSLCSLCLLHSPGYFPCGLPLSC